MTAGRFLLEHDLFRPAYVRYCVVRCATAEIRLHAPRDATNIAPAARRRSGRIANWRSRALPAYGTSPHSE